METTVLILIVPGIFFIFWRKLTLVDRLTIFRSIILTIYGWVISPYLIFKFGLCAGIIMLVFTIATSYLFLVLLGNKSKRSVFISIISFICKILISIYKSITITIVLLEEKFRKNKPPYTLGLIFVNRKPLFSAFLFVFEPYLLLIEHTKMNKEKGVKFWWLMITSHALAVIVWGVFTFYFLIKTYVSLGIF